ncbi:hypothetical protein TURU_034438 [Turdus rufiventris]|nr:hypothetical protein TURU_034438 [Turdus rufiventris]
MPTYEKGLKKDPGNYRPVNLILVSGKVMEQILNVIMPHVQDNQRSRPSFAQRDMDRLDREAKFSNMSQVLDPALGLQHLSASLQAGDRVAGKLPGERCWLTATGREPAVCPHDQEDQWHPGLYQ